MGTEANGSAADGTPDPRRLARVLAEDGVRLVVDPALSDALVRELAAVTGLTPTRDPASGPGPAVHVGPTLPAALREGDALLWAHSTNAGVDALLRPGWPPHALLTRTVGRMGERIAQYVLAWVLADCQRIPDVLADHRARTWERRQGELLDGTHAVVFGTGAIGSAVAAALQRLGVRTTGVARTPRDTPGFDLVIALADAPAALPGARWVVNALPLTPDTRALFAAPLLTAMDGATFVNVGRGESVDLDALRTALTTGHVARAVLDVLPTEPAPPHAPAWDLPRTVITSHSAGVTTDTDIATDFRAAWQQTTEGRLPNLAVRVGAGY
ncbi:NAD(P)-dependent oxidoreductase [Streptomyces sp. NPDC048172]|uniref:NAD(P)-dependent oxidoreductase n=1 Tax=Streptomyces sp. NPDC048172 TaxID=3365505 RepID=UPI00372365E9